MPKVRIFVFILYLFLFAAIPFLGKKEYESRSLPVFQVLADDASYVYLK